MSNYITANLYGNMLSKSTPKLVRAVGFTLIRFSLHFLFSALAGYTLLSAIAIQFKHCDTTICKNTVGVIHFPLKNTFIK